MTSYWEHTKNKVQEHLEKVSMEIGKKGLSIDCKERGCDWLWFYGLIET